MRILIAGAGAVGQVYGQALQRGGAEVLFWVKPKYAEAARAGFRMYPLNGRRAPQHFGGFGVVTDLDEVKSQTWDSLWLTVSTPALAGDWLGALIAATGDATVVGLQPGIEAEERLLPLAGQRLVQGMISFIAYGAPLPGETRFSEPGTAYWFPPSPSPFTGEKGRVQPLVAALRRGGCPATYRASLEPGATFGTGFFQAQVAALDAVDWDWAVALRGDVLDLAARAWREIAAIAAAETGQRPPWWVRFVGAFAARSALRIAPWLIPMDVPTYFGYHFTKVGAQTREHLDGWIARGRAHGLATEATEALRRRLRPEAVFQIAHAEKRS